MVQETNIPRHRFYIHTLYKIENKDESLEKNLLCNLLCPDNMHNYIPPKDNKKLTFILLNFEFGLRVLHNKVNHGNYDLPNNSAHSVYPIAQSKVNKK